MSETDVAVYIVSLVIGSSVDKDIVHPVKKVLVYRTPVEVIYSANSAHGSWLGLLGCGGLIWFIGLLELTSSWPLCSPCLSVNASLRIKRLSNLGREISILNHHLVALLDRIVKLIFYSSKKYCCDVNGLRLIMFFPAMKNKKRGNY